ncbi:hypothetical protein [Bacillus taeanensis]|nr:hypothetical protein [Bacillus taeanensis]
MEMYTKAYQRYSEKCAMFGIHTIDMVEFIKTVTDEQVEMLVREA